MSAGTFQQSWMIVRIFALNHLELENVDLPGGLIDVKAVNDQIAAVTAVNLAPHQIGEKHLPLPEFREWK